MDCSLDWIEVAVVGLDDEVGRAELRHTSTLAVPIAAVGVASMTAPMVKEQRHSYLGPWHYIEVGQHHNCWTWLVDPVEVVEEAYSVEVADLATAYWAYYIQNTHLHYQNH